MERQASTDIDVPQGLRIVGRRIQDFDAKISCELILVNHLFRVACKQYEVLSILDDFDDVTAPTTSVTDS